MGGGGTTVVNSTPPPSATELELQQSQLDISRQQLDAIKQQSAYQSRLFDLAGPLLDAQARAINQSIADESTPEGRARIARRQEIQDQIDQQTLEQLQAGGGATAKQKEVIKQAGTAAIEAGTVDINTFRDESLRVLREELAPQLGLRSTDTPILDRGGKIAEQALKQIGGLVKGVRSSELQAELNFPMAQSMLFNNIATTSNNLNAATASFGDSLAQAAAINRLRIASPALQLPQVAGQFGLGFSTGIPGPGGALQSMAQNRFANTTSTTSRSPGIGDYASAAGGVGGLLSGLGAIGLFSHSSIKENIVEIDPDVALGMCMKLPVKLWRYFWDERMHVGPMAEEFHKVTGLGDGFTIGLFDMLSLMMAALQSINRKMEAA